MGIKGYITPKELVDELTYLSYKHNRTISPHVSVEQWAKVFGISATEAMESRYQSDLCAEDAECAEAQEEADYYAELERGYAQDRI